MHNKKNSDIIRKKIETTMIGALARFEEGFGRLWGHGSDKKLSQDEIRNKIIWDNVRESILDHGNLQIRKALSELKGSKVDKLKYSYYYNLNQEEN